MPVTKTAADNLTIVPHDTAVEILRRIDDRNALHPFFDEPADRDLATPDSGEIVAPDWDEVVAAARELDRLVVAFAVGTPADAANLPRLLALADSDHAIGAIVERLEAVS